MSACTPTSRSTRRSRSLGYSREIIETERLVGVITALFILLSFSDRYDVAIWILSVLIRDRIYNSEI
jgi:hypothetical protein